MKTRAIMMTMGLVFSLNGFANDNNIIITKQKDTDLSKQLEIPVRVNFNMNTLGIHFIEKVQQVFVTVTGPNGLVYQREVTTDNAKSIYVDLTNYEEGEYNINFQDAEGNQVSGDFLKNAEE